MNWFINCLFSISLRVLWNGAGWEFEFDKNGTWNERRMRIRTCFKYCRISVYLIQQHNHEIFHKFNILIERQQFVFIWETFDSASSEDVQN